MMNMDYFSTLSTLDSEPKAADEFITTRYHQLIATDKKKDADEVREKWKKGNISKSINLQSGGLLDILQNPEVDISLLSSYSFLIQFTFTLEKPYISRDEQEFYIIDNPIRKDKVFGLPYVAPSSWKGSLRAALCQLGHKAEDDEIRRIFGNERGEEEHEKLRAGRLHLFPTFFTKKGLEIINPHDRKRRVGTVPILMESVPDESNGLFTLLYIPFDLIGKEEGEIKGNVAKDISLITKGLNAMFRDYGFGARTSSGFGIVKPNLADGTITLRAYGVEASQKEIKKQKRPEEAFQKYLNEDGSVKAEFKGSGGAGLLSRAEYGKKGKQLGGGGRNEFRDFRQWYDAYGEQWQKYLKSRDAPEPEWPLWTFTNFEELMKLAELIENSLTSREDSQ